LANHLPAMFIYCDVSRPLLANKITREFAVHAWTCSRRPQPHTRYYMQRQCNDTLAV